MTLDEATKALIAARKLERLYHAYRASSRANAMVLSRIRDSYAANQEMEASERHRVLQRLTGEMAVSRESDLVFADRIAQIRRRIVELEGILP